MSPLGLLQERVARDRHYPWRVLVVCALLNRTHRRQVRPMFEALFERAPTPEAMLGADLSDLLRPLGLWRRRAETLRRLTFDYLCGCGPASHGAGPYAADSWAIFVEGRTDVRPADRMLKPYMTWSKRWRRRSGPRPSARSTRRGSRRP